MHVNKNIFRITTIMIIILTLILVAIFINYLSKSGDIINMQNSNTHTSGEKAPKTNNNSSKENTVKEISGETTSGELEAESSTNEQEEQPKDSIDAKQEEEEGNKSEPEQSVANLQENSEHEAESGNELSNNISSVKIDFKDASQDPVITSSTETSNQEKQQVLNEIDDALQGLLEAVRKVPTVDESKLDASLESEVQP